MARSRLFHAIVVVGSTLGTSGPIAVGSAGCQFFEGTDEKGGPPKPDQGVEDLRFWAHVDIAQPRDFSGWGNVDIFFAPLPDFSTVDQNADGGTDLAPAVDGDADGATADDAAVDADTASDDADVDAGTDGDA